MSLGCTAAVRGAVQTVIGEGERIVTTKIRNISQRYTLIFCVAVVILSTAIYKSTPYLFVHAPNTTLFAVLQQLVDMIWPTLLVLVLGYGFVFKEKGLGKTFKAGMGFFIFYCSGLVVSTIVALLDKNTQWQSAGTIALGVLILLGIGIREEFLYRGIVQNALALKYAKSAKGIWFTVIVSAVLFGAIHMQNMLGSEGTDFVPTLTQSIGAGSIGMMFGAVYLRGGNIWFMVLLHAIIDASPFFEALFFKSNMNETDAINQINPMAALIIVPLMVGVTLFLLRKSQHPEILGRMERLRNSL